jgi:DNA-directed RNA polymerase specialized sigma24 family protein
MSENTTATTGETADDRRAVTDGGRLVLRYGTPAESVGEPGRVFAQFDGEFVLLRRQVLDWGMITDNEVEPGVVTLDDVPGSQLGRLRSATESVEIDDLAQRLAENSGLDEFGAQVLLLFEGFELDPPEIASELSTAEEAVVEEIENIYNQYDEDEIAAMVQEHHPDIEDDLVRAFVLSRGFAWETDEIAADLGVDEVTVEDYLDTAQAEHEELEETLQDVI